MKISAASAADVPALAGLMAASPLLRRYGVTDRGARRSLADARRTRDLILVARDGAEVVGLAWLVATRALDRAGYLRLLLVADRHRSSGIGAALLRRGEAGLAARGCRHVVLLVTSTNRRAKSFYLRHGYRRVGALPSFARPGIDETLYAKTLRGRA